MGYQKSFKANLLFFLKSSVFSFCFIFQWRSHFTRRATSIHAKVHVRIFLRDVGLKDAERALLFSAGPCVCNTSFSIAISCVSFVVADRRAPAS